PGDGSPRTGDGGGSDAGAQDRRPPRRYELPGPVFPSVVHVEGASGRDELPFQHRRRIPGSRPSPAPVSPDLVGSERLQPVPLEPFPARTAGPTPLGQPPPPPRRPPPPAPRGGAPPPPAPLPPPPPPPATPPPPPP